MSYQMTLDRKEEVSCTLILYSPKQAWKLLHRSELIFYIP